MSLTVDEDSSWINTLENFNAIFGNWSRAVNSILATSTLDFRCVFNSWIACFFISSSYKKAMAINKLIMTNSWGLRWS